MNLRAGFQQRVASVLLLSMLAACASRQVGAPVVDRTVGGTTTDSSVPGGAPVIDNTPVPAGDEAQAQARIVGVALVGAMTNAGTAWVLTDYQDSEACMVASCRRVLRGALI